MTLRRTIQALATALLVAAAMLVQPAAVGASSQARLDDGRTMRVSARSGSAPMDGSIYTGRPEHFGIFYEIFTDDGETLESGWIPGTQDEVNDLQPTVDFEMWTHQAVLVWSRGYGDQRDLYLSRYVDGIWTVPQPLTNGQAGDSGPVLVADNLARLHLVWWRPTGGGTALYYRFHVWSSIPPEHDPVVLDLGFDDDDGEELRPYFPYIAYQESTELLWLVHRRGDDEIGVHSFPTVSAGDPTGGGEIIVPVSVVTRPEPDGEEEGIQPLITFAGSDQRPVVYWVDAEVLHYFYLFDGGIPSAVRQVSLAAEYDDAALEQIVLELVEAERAHPNRPVRSPIQVGDRTARSTLR